MPREPILHTLREGAFEGTVSHCRQYDVRHQFRYPVWMCLAELSSCRLPGLLRPRFERYLTRSEILAKFSQTLPEDMQVWLLTQPSMFGRSFNPVSFYFVSQGNQLVGIVAHITNTPWDESHCYVLEQQTEQLWTFDKTFHVSPFMPMDLRYVWRFEVTGERLLVTMQLLDEGERIFTAALNLRPVEQTRWLPLRLRLQYPCQNLLTLGRIYWQALRLKLKGARFHAHPDSTTAVPGTTR